MDEVSFIETWSGIDETDLSMNVSIDGNEGETDESSVPQDSSVAGASGSSNQLKSDSNANANICITDVQQSPTI